MKIKDLTAFLEEIAPLHLQENYDNAGLIVGSPQTEIRGVLFCLDSTEAVVAEAMRLGCNLVVAHHPIIFRGLKKINGKNYVERTIIEAIRNDISIYAIHTNLDNVLSNGVNEKIAHQLGLTGLQILSPKKRPRQRDRPEYRRRGRWKFAQTDCRARFSAFSQRKNGRGHRPAHGFARPKCAKSGRLRRFGQFFVARCDCCWGRHLCDVRFQIPRVF